MKLVLTIVLSFICCFSSTAQPNNHLIFPNSTQLNWQNAELGVVFHYDLHVFDNKKYNQVENRLVPVANYQIFHPKQLNTDQWIQAAKAAGATFALFTVTHETGFAMFQSNVNPYSLKALKWRNGEADIARDFVNSCRKYGIKPGFYIGIRWNSMLGVHDFKINDVDTARMVLRQNYYNHMIEEMVRELCTNYGDLFEIWFDGGASDPKLGVPNVLPIVQKYQPNALFYWSAERCDARWAGSESGTVGYPNWATFTYKSTYAPYFPQIYDNHARLLKHGDVNGAYWMPAMSDAPLRGFNDRHEWFWEPGDEAHIQPLDSLVKMYYHSVGRNSTLILGLTPDTAGLLPAADVALV